MELNLSVMHSKNWVEVGEGLVQQKISVPTIEDLHLSNAVIQAAIKMVNSGQTTRFFVKELTSQYQDHSEWEKLNNIYSDKLNYFKEDTILLERCLRLYALIFRDYKRYLQKLDLPFHNLLFSAISDSGATIFEKKIDGVCYYRSSVFWDYFYPPNSPIDRASVRYLSDRMIERRNIILQANEPVIYNLNYSNYSNSSKGLEVDGEKVFTYPGWGVNFFKEWAVL